MRKKLIPLLITVVMLFSIIPLSACTSGGTDNSKTDAPQKVAALSSSFGEAWMLAGGELTMVTEDFFDERDLGVDKDSVQIVGTVKEPNAELIIEENPDLVILSADIDSHAKLEPVLTEAGIPVYKAKIESFDDYLKTLKDFTDMTGREDLYKKNGTDVEAEIQSIVDADAADPQNAPTALVLRAFSSGISVINKEHVVCDIMDNLGITNVANGNTELTELSMESIIAEDPDYIFLLTMGDENEALQNLEDSLYKDPAWKDLSAVKNDNLILLPKNLFHYKPNAKWGDAYEYIADLINKK